MGGGDNRPGQSITYTSNWPYDPLVGNQPVAGMLIWSIASVIILIFFIGIVIFLYSRYMHEGDYKGKLVTKIPRAHADGQPESNPCLFHHRHGAVRAPGSPGRGNGPLHGGGRELPRDSH